MPSENETWLIDTGDAVVRKKARDGAGCRLPWETLVYCVWVADYGMRNAGDLDTSADLFPEFQQEAKCLAEQLSLPLTYEMFCLPKDDLENRYFDRFESVCGELKDSKPVEAVEVKVRRMRRLK